MAAFAARPGRRLATAPPTTVKLETYLDGFMATKGPSSGGRGEARAALLAQLRQHTSAQGPPSRADLARAEKWLRRLPQSDVDGDILVMCMGFVKHARVPLDQLTKGYVSEVHRKMKSAAQANENILSLQQLALLVESTGQVGHAGKVSHDMIFLLARLISRSPPREFVDDWHFRCLFAGLRKLRDEHLSTQRLVAALSDCIESWEIRLTEGHLSSAVYGLQSMSEGQAAVRRLLATLCRDLQRNGEQEVLMNGTQLSSLIFGLKSMSGDAKEVRAVLAIAIRAMRNPSTRLRMSEREVCTALYGLQSMSSDVPEVQCVMAALADKLSSNADVFSARCLSMAYFGLQNKSQHTPSTRQVLRLLAAKARKSSPEEWNFPRLASAFVGIRTMTTSTTEVKDALKHLGVLLRGRRDTRVVDRSICNIMYSMRFKNSNCPEVRGVLKAMHRLLTSCTSRFTAAGISSMLNGLRSMTSDHVEVRKVVDALARHVSNCDDKISSGEIAGALVGLQGLKSRHAEVSVLVGELTKLILKHPLNEQWKASEISTAMYGLRSMSNRNDDVCKLLDVLRLYFETSDALLSDLELGKAFYGMRGMTGESKESKAMLATLTQMLSRHGGSFSPLATMNCIKGTYRLAGDYPEYHSFMFHLREHVVKCDGGALFSSSSAKSAADILMGAELSTPTKLVHRDLAVSIIQNMATIPAQR